MDIVFKMKLARARDRNKNKDLHKPRRDSKVLAMIRVEIAHALKFGIRKNPDSEFWLLAPKGGWPD